MPVSAIDKARRFGMLVAIAIFASCGGRIAPQEESPATPVAEVSAGGGHVCALLRNGELRCWGQNDVGQLGNGLTDELCTREPRSPSCSLRPTSVVGIPDAVKVCAGGWHSCALRANADVMCWGRNDWGQLGDGTAVNRAVPVRVVGLPANVVEVACGLGVGTCARTIDGDVWCWGESMLEPREGNLPKGHPVAQQVAAIRHATQIAIGWDRACAVIDDGSVQCWGNSRHGCEHERPLTPVPTAIPDVRDATAISSSADVILRADGSLLTGFAGCPTPGVIGTVRDAVQVSGDEVSLCYRDRRGVGHCIDSGGNSPAILGDGTRHRDLDRVSTLPFAPLAQVAVGLWVACAIDVRGELRCWGNNYSGAVGDGTTTDRDVPTLVRL